MHEPVATATAATGLGPAMDLWVRPSDAERREASCTCTHACAHGADPYVFTPKAVRGPLHRSLFAATSFLSVTGTAQYSLLLRCTLIFFVATKQFSFLLRLRIILSSLTSHPFACHVQSPVCLIHSDVFSVAAKAAQTRTESYLPQHSPAYMRRNVSQSTRALLHAQECLPQHSPAYMRRNDTALTVLLDVHACIDGLLTTYAACACATCAWTHCPRTSQRGRPDSMPDRCLKQF